MLLGCHAASQPRFTHTYPNQPQVTVGREEEVAVAELQEVHWRVLGAPARGFRQPLPQVDVFAPPRVRGMRWCWVWVWVWGAGW